MTIDIDVTLSRSEKFDQQHPNLIMPGENPFSEHYDLLDKYLSRLSADFSTGLEVEFTGAKILDELGRKIDADLSFEAAHLRVTTVC